MCELAVFSKKMGRWVKKAENLLLEQDGSETSVERTNTLVLEHLGESTNQAIGVGRLRHQTDTGSLKRAQRNISKELGERGRGEVDGSAVVGGGLVANPVDGLLLEQLVSSELERTLQEVSRGGGTETGQEGTGTLVGDDLLDTAEETAVIGGRVELDSGLDAVEIISSA
jgi:hypothetical protein